jgi:alpha-beta hydrolase superfamily lysophospholipase
MATDYLEMTFDSEGTECAASLYRPAGAARSVPCVVMGTGLGGTRNIVLPFYARRFAASGLAALTFDYRRFGGSGGTPRQLMHGAHQQNDYRAAIRFARSLPGIDPRRIALWGASFGGVHVLTIGATDPSIAAVIAVTPGLFAARAAVFKLARLAALSLADAIRVRRGHPRLRPLVGDRREGALITDPDTQRVLRGIVEGVPGWRNEISFAKIWTLPRPRRPSTLTMPRAGVRGRPGQDHVTDVARRAARSAPHGQARHYPAGHVDLHLSPVVDQVIADQLRFLHVHLTVNH